MKEDRSVPPWIAVVVGVAVASAAATPFWFLFAFRWGEGAVWQGFQDLSRNVWRLIALLLASAVVHELLHAAGWVLWGKAPWKAIRFGVHWQMLSPYAHLTVPITARPYRWGVALPGLVLGVLPALAAVITGGGALFVYGLVMILAAGGDLVVLGLLSRVPGDWFVQDSAHRVGAVVWPRGGGT